MNGIINIYKEKGYTSHDAVARLRGITGLRRIGHTGTLDPDAEGVLPICMGTATKAVDILTDRSKVYETVLLLGIETDTQDTSGRIINAAADIGSVTDEEIRAAVASFAGTYMQLPPMYSAVKVDGQKLCEIARLGREVEREAKEVTIYSIEMVSDIVRGCLKDIENMSLLGLHEDSCLGSYGSGEFKEQGHWQRRSDSIAAGSESLGSAQGEAADGKVCAGPDTPVIRLALRIECSKGTYIRTLCKDIGDRLGIYGCMEKLLRTRVGSFEIRDSLKLKEVEGLVAEGRLEEALKAPDACFAEYKKLTTKAKYDELLFNGNELFFRHFAEYITEPPTPVRVYSSKGEFLAVYEYNPKRNKYKPLRMFREEIPESHREKQ